MEAQNTFVRISMNPMIEKKTNKNTKTAVLN